MNGFIVAGVLGMIASAMLFASGAAGPVVQFAVFAAGLAVAMYGAAGPSDSRLGPPRQRPSGGDHWV
jgi:hypothetical protein